MIMAAETSTGLELPQTLLYFHCLKTRCSLLHLEACRCTAGCRPESLQVAAKAFQQGDSELWQRGSRQKLQQLVRADVLRLPHL